MCHQHIGWQRHPYWRPWWDVPCVGIRIVLYHRFSVHDFVSLLVTVKVGVCGVLPPHLLPLLTESVAQNEHLKQVEEDLLEVLQANSTVALNRCVDTSAMLGCWGGANTKYPCSTLDAMRERYNVTNAFVLADAELASGVMVPFMRSWLSAGGKRFLTRLCLFGDVEPRQVGLGARQRADGVGTRSGRGEVVRSCSVLKCPSSPPSGCFVCGLRYPTLRPAACRRSLPSATLTGGARWKS